MARLDHPCGKDAPSGEISISTFAQAIGSGSEPSAEEALLTNGSGELSLASLAASSSETRIGLATCSFRGYCAGTTNELTSKASFGRGDNMIVFQGSPPPAIAFLFSPFH